MVERLTLFLPLSVLPLQADRDGKASFERGQINLTVCGFQCFSSLLGYISVPSDRRPEGNS